MVVFRCRIIVGCCSKPWIVAMWHCLSAILLIHHGTFCMKKPGMRTNVMCLEKLKANVVPFFVLLPFLCYLLSAVSFCAAYCVAYYAIFPATSTQVKL